MGLEKDVLTPFALFQVIYFYILAHVAIHALDTKCKVPCLQVQSLLLHETLRQHKQISVSLPGSSCSKRLARCQWRSCILDQQVKVETGSSRLVAKCHVAYCPQDSRPVAPATRQYACRDVCASLWHTAPQQLAACWLVLLNMTQTITCFFSENAGHQRGLCIICKRERHT